MNLAFKNQWLAALRSGSYQQTRTVLSDGVGFCCLGVLCEVARIKYNPDSYFLPESFATKAGLDRDAQSKLADMNDGCVTNKFTPPDSYTESHRREDGTRTNGMTFEAIADYIEENL